MRKRVIATLMATLIFVLGFSALNLTAKAAEIVSVKVNGTPVRFVLDRKTMTATVDGDASQVTLPEKIKINGYLYFKVVGGEEEAAKADNKGTTGKADKGTTDKTTTGSASKVDKATTDNRGKTDKPSTANNDSKVTTGNTANIETSDEILVGRKRYPAYKGDRNLLTGFSNKTGGFQEFHAGDGYQGRYDYHLFKTNEDGSFYRTITFQTSLGEAELDKVTFEVIDVTPKAFKELFDAMNVPDGARVSMGETVTGTKTKKINGVSYGFTFFGKVLTVEAKQGTRAVKVVAKRDGKVIDAAYLISNSNFGKKASAADMRLYDTVRHKIESVLWTDGMSNLEKLEAMAAYLNKTLRYPGTQACEKGTKWWNDFSVDGKDLFYNINCDDMSNYIMFYQGGIKTCYAAYNLMDLAKRDLGLPAVYVENGRATDMTDPSKARYLTADEGVFIGAVKCSRNPSALDHVTLWYKEAGAWKTSQFFRKPGDGNPNIKGIDVAGNTSAKAVGEIIKLR